MAEFSRWDINPSTYPTPEAMSTPDWCQITDTTGRLAPFFVRVGTASDGRLIITGLALGNDGEVTADVLRSIKLAEIVKTMRWRESGSLPPKSGGLPDPESGLARFEITSMVETHATPQPTESRRGRRDPDRGQLETFAAAYRRHASYTKRGAVVAAGRDCNVPRATAYRWAERCRALGLIPQREENEMHAPDQEGGGDNGT